MRAMRVERADAALLVAKDDDLLAQELFLPRQIAKLIGGAHRLPIAAQEFAHRAPRLDAGQLVIGSRNLRSIGCFHDSPPGRHRPALFEADASAAPSCLSTPALGLGAGNISRFAP